VGQVWRPGVTFHAPGSVGECEGMNPTLPSELPLWELESLWTPEFSESHCKGQNPLDWKVPYIIEKLLKRMCPKWAHMTHLDTSNTSYGQKKGWESNCQIWLSTTKSQESPRFPYVKVACDIPLESLQWGYNFSLDLISIASLDTMLWPLKIAEVPTLGISRLALGGLGTKWHLGVGPVAMHKV
jgi:hypothetical protein